MGLIRKCPVQNPCEAETFEEAFLKNRARYAFERQEATKLYADMVADKDPHAESVNPDFWAGCQAANEDAYQIVKAELREALKRAAEKIAETKSFSESAQVKHGYKEVRDKWAEAAKTDDPKMIVYW
jgi:hypothetical protein